MLIEFIDEFLASTCTVAAVVEFTVVNLMRRMPLPLSTIRLPIFHLRSLTWRLSTAEMLQAGKFHIDLSNKNAIFSFFFLSFFSNCSNNFIFLYNLLFNLYFPSVRKNFSGSWWKFAPRGSFLRRSRIWHYFFDPEPGSRKFRLNLHYFWSWTAISPFIRNQERRGQKHFCGELLAV